jgi:hypothetical protein
MTDLIIDSAGTVRCLYDEVFDLLTLGHVQLQRTSHVEPDAHGSWWADLAPVAGPRLGPYALRSLAIAAEQEWVTKHVLKS